MLRPDGQPLIVLAGNDAGGGLVELRRGEAAELVLALSAESKGGMVRLGTGGPAGQRSYGELGPTHWRVHGKADQMLWDLGLGPRGGGALRLCDPDGETVCEIGAEALLTGRLALATGSTELEAIEPVKDAPLEQLRVRSLQLVGEGDTVIGSLGKNESGGGSLELRAKEGGAVLRLGQGPAGHGRLELRDRAGELAGEFSATALGEGALTLFGRKERPLMRLQPKSEGSCRWAASSRSSTTAATRSSGSASTPRALVRSASSTARARAASSCRAERDQFQSTCSAWLRFEPVPQTLN